MTRTKKVKVAICMLAFCMGITSAQQTTIKRRKMTVAVEKDKNCPQGISVSGRFVGGRQLCVDYPEGVSYQFQKLVGSTVEVEAFWTFEGDPKRDTAVALGQVIRIGGDKVDDTCAIKTHSSGVTPIANNGKDAAPTVAVLSPGCHPSDTTARAAISEINNEGQK